MAQLQAQPSIAPDLRVKALMKLIARLDGIDLSPMLVYRIDSAPASAIPYLAWQFDVASPLWQLIEAIDQRSMIKAMAALHQTKGTPAAIKSALAALGWPQAQLLEGQSSWGANSYPPNEGWAACRVVNRMGVTLSTYDLAVLALGPTGYWKLDDPNVIARDVSPNANDTLIPASPTTAVGITPLAAPLLPDGEPSMSFEGPYGTAEVAGVGAAFMVAWVASATPIPSPLHFYPAYRLSDAFWLEAQAAVPDTLPHFVATGSDGSTSSLYLDGALVLSGSQSFTNLFGGLFIGMGSGPQWEGRIGRVAVFDHVLTAAQIAALYQAGISSRAAAAVVPPTAPAAAAGLIAAAFNFFKPERCWLDAVVFESAPQADGMANPADLAAGFSQYHDITGVFDVLGTLRDSFSFALPAASDLYALPLTYDKRSQHAGDSYANVRVGPSDGATTLNGNPVEGNP